MADLYDIAATQPKRLVPVGPDLEALARKLEEKAVRAVCGEAVAAYRDAARIVRKAAMM